MIPIASCAKSDVGRKREQNEDSFVADDELRLYVVADGMGGHAAGEIASAQAVTSIRAALVERWEQIRELSAAGTVEAHAELERIMEGAIARACLDIHGLSADDARRRGMGTTVVALLCAGGRGVIGHVGDSRVYLLRHGEVNQLTVDHTLVEEQVSRGLITREQARTLPNRNILLRAVGVEPEVVVDTLVSDLLPGDVFLLCTDGLHDYLADDELPKLLSAERLEEVPARLVDLANERGGKDNVTAVVVAVGKDDQLHTDIGGKTQALRRIPLFEQMTYREALELLAISQTRRYEASAVIIREGDPGEEMFAMVRGRVEVHKNGQPIAQLRAGGFFGEMVLYDQQVVRSASVTAIEPTVVIALEREGLLRLMKKDSELAVKLLWSFGRIMSARLRNTIHVLSVQKAELEQLEVERADTLVE